MAATTHDGITYTPGSGDPVEFTADLTLDLYAGTPGDNTDWLDGNAGGSYPGSLTGFLASNSDGNAVGGAKLVCGQFTTALVNDETVTLTGDATRVLAVIVGDNSTESAAVTLKNITNGVAQFTVTGTSDAKVTCWMIVA